MWQGCPNSEFKGKLHSGGNRDFLSEMSSLIFKGITTVLCSVVGLQFKRKWIIFIQTMELCPCHFAMPTPWENGCSSLKTLRYICSPHTLNCCKCCTAMQGIHQGNLHEPWILWGHRLFLLSSHHYCLGENTISAAHSLVE